MNSMASQSILREQRWEKSCRAERRGDYATAFEIHQTILAEDTTSYGAWLRAGWLSYQLGNYEESLRFYEQAGTMTKDEWPKYGIKNCRIALGDTDALGKMT
ncbi:MAG: tetratricopeptide repeat protein [Kiritimatiellales bacterium]|nr:tetratricopeptide repeat protein [Kiritimatiellales bacterium]